MNEFLAWMEASALGQFMRDSAWAWPVAEIAHFIGLSLLMGSLLVIDLRLLRLLPNLPLQAALRFLPLSLVGFAINLATGILFCFGDPLRYYPNIAFRLKMLFVLLAGLNAIWFKLAIATKDESALDQPRVAAVAKIIAAISLLLWIGVIVMGRFIPYVEDLGMNREFLPSPQPMTVKM
jgi:hypothetical protein